MKTIAAITGFLRQQYDAHLLDFYLQHDGLETQVIKSKPDATAALQAVTG
ncbi:MAG TPA: hypothetical protein VMV10_16125 [Pirellulales bacterium]|nr:hypothetical protein [Pirellulales bacterium]